MAICPNCGKEVNEGAVCSCQQTAQAKPASNIDVQAMATGFVAMVKEIIANPVAGVKNFVNNVSWIVMAILVAINAIINVVDGVFEKIKHNINAIKYFKDQEDHYEDMADMLDMDLDDYIDEYNLEPDTIGIFDFIKDAFFDVVYVAAGVAIVAVVFFFAVKLINKIQMTWKQAFAIATINLLIYLPLRLVTEFLGIIPSFTLLSWIISAISSVSSWGGTILRFLAVDSVCGDTKKTIYAGVPAVAVISLATSFVWFLLYSLF